MANFDASINLKVTTAGAQRQIKKLERSLSRLNNGLAVVEQLNQSLNRAQGSLGDLNRTVKLRVDDSQLKTALRQLDRLNTSRTVRFQGSASAAAAPSPSASGGLSDGLGLATVAATKTNNELAKLTDWLQDTERRTKGKSPFIKYLDIDSKPIEELDKLTKELDSNIRKRAGKALNLDDEINDLVKFKGAATEGTFAIDNQIRALDRERNSLIQSNRQDQERIASLEKRKKKLLDVAAAQDKANKARARGANFGRGLGAGLAFSNLPGAGIAQQIGAGALVGGKAGAIGAGIGVIVSGLAAVAGPAAVATAELQKLEIALRGILGTRTEEGLRVIDKAARDFNQSIADATRNFTQLSAAAVANGNSVEEIENLYRGLSAAVKGTGGNAEDLNGVLRAATQVISKGKVQAEELRGQIGDRLPGAFQLFAKATGRSTAELDKALQDGKVTANEFVTDFATFIRNKYEPAAKRIGDSPAEAGARLTKALEDLERSVGPIFQRLGSQFADFATEAIKELKRVFDFLATVSDAIEEKLGSGVKNIGTLIRNRDIAQRSLEKLLKEQAETPVSDLVKQEDLQFKINVQLQAIENIEKRLKAIGAKDLPTPPKPKKPIEVGDEVDPGIGAADEAQRAAERLSNARRITREKAAQLEIDRRLEEAILRQDRAEQAILQGERDVLLVRQRLAVANQSAASEAEKQQLLKAAELDVDRISIRVQRELAEISRDKTTELKEQRDLLLQIAGIERTATGAKPIEDPTQDLRDELRGLQNQRKFGGDADLAAKVEDLVLNKGVPFNEAFDLAEQVKAQRELNAETERYNQLIASVSNTIETGIIDAISVGIDALVRGTEDLDRALKDIAAGVLQDISRQLLSAAVSLGLRSLGGNDGVGVFSRLFPQREEGGPVSSGVSYLVGEKGPELFTPDRNGQIIDNDAFTAAASALRSSDSITPAEGEDASEAFSQAAAALVRNSTIITTNSQTSNQALMAESMQASMAASKEPIRLQTTVINSVEYATVEQVGEAMKQTKKQTEAEVFTKLKNRPAVRRSVGM